MIAGSLRIQVKYCVDVGGKFLSPRLNGTKVLKAWHSRECSLFKGLCLHVLYTFFFQPAFLGNCPGVSRETVEYTISKYRETLQVLRTTDVLGQLVSCPETSVGNYHYSLRKNTEERSSHVLCWGSLKSRIPSISRNIRECLIGIWQYWINLRELPTVSWVFWSVNVVVGTGFSRDMTSCFTDFLHEKKIW